MYRYINTSWNISIHFSFNQRDKIMEPINIQLQKELDYSKRMRNNLILTDILDDIPSKITESLCLTIDNYRAGNYYESKQLRIKRLPETIEVVNNIFAIVLSSDSNKPIQGPATELGMSLGYRNQIDAVKTGAEILSICHGKLYDIQLSDDGTEILPKYKLGKAIIKYPLFFNLFVRN